jgi:glycine/D-amino acid oxidase-like deaminating enzyme
MPKTTYGRSLWLDRFPPSRIPDYPRQRGRQTTDVVVVGGGLTGCATAYAMSAAGIKVVLVEADRIGRAGTASGAGWISDDPGVDFSALEKAFGLRRARQAWQAWHRAGLDLSALIRRLEIKCQLETRSTVTLAVGNEQALRLKREQKARRDAGLQAALIAGRAIAAEVGLPASAALRTRDSATFDPYRAAIGLAAAAVERGTQCFERSVVRKITFTRKAADVHLSSGSIHAQRVVIATGSPTGLFKGLRRHFWFDVGYLTVTGPIPAKIRQGLGTRATIVRDLARPPHTVRWIDDERLLVMGADAQAPGDRLRGKALIQRTGQLMYELSTLYPEISGIPPAYGWETPYTRTVDGLPFIGPHRNYPHHLFAFGAAAHSATVAQLASRILLRHHLAESDPADEIFGFR